MAKTIKKAIKKASAPAKKAAPKKAAKKVSAPPKKVVSRKTAPKKAAPAKSTATKKPVPAKPQITNSSQLEPAQRTAVPRQYAEPKFVAPDGQRGNGDVTDYDALSKNAQALPPRPAAAPDFMNLADVLGASATDAITSAGQLVFHSVGDTGADKQNRVNDEADVAAAMAKDLATQTAKERPAFFYHLGDVVYEFGEEKFYYEQFYEPFCMYNAPIFAIPGNHDGMVYNTDMQSCGGFLNNFCTPVVQHADNAASLHRTTMNQPGVYFTLEAPFASIIGLYSNTSDKGYGIISSPDPVSASSVVGQEQKNFLIRELKRIAAARTNGTVKALILAVHHPAYKGNDISVKPLTDDLESAFTAAGIWPDLVLSGHEHNYARYTRTMPNGNQIAYIIAGDGGYNVTPTAPASDPSVKIPISIANGDPTYKAYVKDFGYLKIKVSASKLAVVFNGINSAYGPAFDSIVLDLKTHKITEQPKGVEPML